MKYKRKMHIWKPTENIDNILGLINLEANCKSLRLIFTDESNTEYTFLYDKLVEGKNILAFRYADEVTRTDLADIAADARDNASVKPNRGWSLYKMTNSDYIDWFRDHYRFGVKGIEHHVYVTHNFVIEVLSVYEPRIEVK